MDGKRSVGAVDFLTDVVGEVENGRGASRSQHAVVHWLDHPANFLSKGQVLRGREREVGDVKGGRRGSRVIGVKSGHVVVGVGLNEHPPSCGCRRPAVGPREGGRAVSLESVGCGIPNDGTAGWTGVHAAHGRRSDRAVFPREREVRALAGAALGGRECDLIRGLAGGVDHQRNVILACSHGGLNGLGNIEIHPVIRYAVNKINVATDVGADGTAAALSPCVRPVVRRAVGRRGPRLQNGANGNRFVFHRAVLCEQAQFSNGDTRTAGLGHLIQWHTNETGCLVAARGLTDEQGGGILVRVVRARPVLNDVGVNEMWGAEMRQGAVMAQLHRGLGGVEHDRVQVGQLEVVGVGPVADLVGGRNGTDPPVPRLALIEVGLERKRGVGKVKACIVPGRVSHTVYR